MSLPVRLLPEFRGERCLNCNTPLEKADKYCHQCGQINSKKRLSLFDFFAEFLANFISYDNRIWRTISGILFKPGKVTKEYCAGRRMHFANPFRFFLTVSIVFFLVLQLSLKISPDITTPLNIASDTGNKEGLFNFTVDSTIKNREDLLNQFKKIEDSIEVNGNTMQKLLIKQAAKEIENDSTPIQFNRTYHSQEDLDAMNFVFRYFKQISDYSSFYQRHSSLSEEQALKQLNHRVDNSNISRYRKGAKVEDLNDPAVLLDILLPKIPLFLFFFAPLLSLIFWLLYMRSTFNFMEHMVFNFHLLTFIFLGFYFMLAEVTLFGTGILAMIFFGLIGPIYLYKAMRHFYHQGRFKTILKFLIINFVFLVLISVSSALFIGGSIFLSL